MYLGIHGVTTDAHKINSVPALRKRQSPLTNQSTGIFETLAILFFYLIILLK